MRLGSQSDEAKAVRLDRLWLVAFALGLRVAVALYAGSRFPPADDGIFYHAVASRIAQGQGYTWAWPDGAITYAAHYPVGYPALLGLAYAVLGSSPLVAMLLNAVLGALLVLGVHACALNISSRAGARLAALMVALHPTLILYTAALMTEVAAAAVLLLLCALALYLGRGVGSARLRWLLGLGGTVLILLRPQLLPLLPLLGALAVFVAPGTPLRSELWVRGRGALLTLALGVTFCLPWTFRNCAKMDGCVFVSANGGWNLLIGTLPEGRGSFAPIAGASVPGPCREVFGEAGKDRCFGNAGARRILADPVGWASLLPQKLGQLFNHGSVAAPYLHAANPSLVTEQIRFGLGAAETVLSRLLLVAACLGVFRASLGRVARGSALAAAAAGLSPWAYVSQLGLFVSLGAGRPGPNREPVRLLALALLGLLLLTHALFFGAARYALLWLPWLCLLSVLPGRRAGSWPPADKSAQRPGLAESFDSDAAARR